MIHLRTVLGRSALHLTLALHILHQRSPYICPLEIILFLLIFFHLEVSLQNEMKKNRRKIMIFQ